MICSVEKVLSNSKITDDVYKISISGKFDGKPGQFYMLKSLFKEPLLPRPISIYSVKENKIEFLYKVVGEGTRLISNLKFNDDIQIMGPLGNTFDLNIENKKVAMVSGGIGIAPLLYLKDNLKNCSIDFYAGFKDKPFSVDNVEKTVNNLYISLEKRIDMDKLVSYQQAKNVKVVDNSYITDIFSAEKYEIVYCCGPKIMMQKVVNMCIQKSVPIYVSMENKMACGMGVCLGCTCKTLDGNKRVCSDGPVFNAKDLIF